MSCKEITRDGICRVDGRECTDLTPDCVFVSGMEEMEE